MDMMYYPWVGVQLLLLFAIAHRTPLVPSHIINQINALASDPSAWSITSLSLSLLDPKVHRVFMRAPGSHDC